MNVVMSILSVSWVALLSRTIGTVGGFPQVNGRALSAAALPPTADPDTRRIVGVLTAEGLLTRRGTGPGGTSMSRLPCVPWDAGGGVDGVKTPSQNGRWSSWTWRSRSMQPTPRLGRLRERLRGDAAPGAARPPELPSRLLCNRTVTAQPTLLLSACARSSPSGRGRGSLH